MKRIAIAAVTSAAMIAGPVALAGPAAADNCKPRYESCAKTPTKAEPIRERIREDRVPKVVVAVARAGNRAPVGKIVVRIIKPNGKVKRLKIRNFMAGESELVRLPQLKGGNRAGGKKYKIRVSFVPRNEKFAVTKSKTEIRVKKASRR